MKKLFSLAFVLALFVISSCSKGGGSGSGELTGVQGRPKAYAEPDPYGMVFIPQGSYNMGLMTRKSPGRNHHKLKLSQLILSGWMKPKSQTTNTVSLYFGFAIRSCADYWGYLEDFLITEDANGNPIEPPSINWETKIDTRDEETNDILSQLYLNQQEHFYNKKEIDTRKLNYEIFLD